MKILVALPIEVPEGNYCYHIDKGCCQFFASDQRPPYCTLQVGKPVEEMDNFHKPAKCQELVRVLRSNEAPAGKAKKYNDAVQSMDSIVAPRVRAPDNHAAATVDGRAVEVVEVMP